LISYLTENTACFHYKYQLDKAVREMAAISWKNDVWAESRVPSC